MGVALLLAEYRLGDTTKIITDIMNSAAATAFEKVPDPIFNGEAHMQHIVFSAEMKTILEEAAKANGCLLYTRKPR